MKLTEDQTMAVTSMFNHVTLYTALFRAATTQQERDELKKHQCYVLTGYAGTGKALANDQIVQTPNGHKKMGDVEVGDLVYGVDGVSTKVTGVYPQGERQSYRVTFRDGASVECDEDHLWTVWTHKQRSKGADPCTLTLREIMNRGIKYPSGPNKFYIPLCSPVQYEEKILPIHPYLLGVLLGDGSLVGTSTLISCPDGDREIIEKIKPLLADGIVLTEQRAPSCPQYLLTDPSNYRNRVTSLISELGLNVKSGEKFIPEVYKRGSVDQRYALLRGLMDTDGCCQNNRSTFSTKSKFLAEGVADIARSLGGTAVIKNQKREGEICVNVKTFENPFSLKRKADNWSLSWKNPPSRAITGVEKTSVKTHTCIKVEAAHSLFLTNDYIVTHNTIVIKALYDELKRLSMPIAKSIDPVPDSINGVIAAFTGRACENLNEKGVPCATSHSLFYEPVVDEKGNLRYFKAKSVQEVDETIGDFVIIEEASMMDLAFIDKVMATGKAIIFVGDDAQLPPINGESIFDVIGIQANYKCSAMMMLEEIKRTGEGSTINLLADKMRRGFGFDFKVTGYDVEQLGKRDFNLKWLRQNWDQWNIILCGTNKTRKKYNQLVRVASGFGDDLPEVGERIVCLKNNVVANTKLNNGELYEVKSVFPGNKVSSFQVQKTIGSGDSSGPLLTIMVDNNMWDEEKRLEENFGRQDIQDFTYGYALTVHKMQGSSMPNVIFFDEDVSFFLDQQKFRYTGITRPSEKLLVVL